jgi:hypothetical protein
MSFWLFIRRSFCSLSLNVSSLRLCKILQPMTAGEPPHLIQLCLLLPQHRRVRTAGAGGLGGGRRVRRRWRHLRGSLFQFCTQRGILKPQTLELR